MFPSYATDLHLDRFPHADRRQPARDAEIRLRVQRA